MEAAIGTTSGMSARARLRTARLVARAVVDDPIDVALDARERFAERAKREHGGGFMPWPPCPYDEDERWHEELHRLCGWGWPCAAQEGFDAVWAAVTLPFRESGVHLGRGAFGGWGDGEPGVVGAVWCVAHHLRPQTVVETGVARGITSRFILEALTANGTGRLWSVDRPPIRRPDLHAQVGAAVPEELRPRWTLVVGSSRRRLPRLVRALGEIDLFLHDSRHTERNLLFELGVARRGIREGGILIADDVDLNCGMHRYRAAHPTDTVLICPARPLEPDPGRQSDRGVFAVIVRGG